MTMKSLEVMSLFRRLIREARLMPTPNRRVFVIRKCRSELERHAKETDAGKLGELMQLMEIQVDNVKSQAQHLRDLDKRGVLKS